MEQVSIADYTLITNTQAKVSMNTNTSATAEKAALVTIDQVAYNSNYSIDISNDGASAPNKVYSATGLEVIPGSYEVEDGGICAQADAQTFTKTSGSKSGLSFRVINQCQAYLTGGSEVQHRVTRVRIAKIPNYPITKFGEKRIEIYGPYFNIRWRASGGIAGSGSQSLYWDIDAIIDNDWVAGGSPQGVYTSGDAGGRVEVTKVDSRSFSDARYVSRHKVDVQLRNGGVGWRKGDAVTVSMSGRSYTVRVTSDRFTYAYNSAGSANYSTPVDSTTGVLDVGTVVSGLVSAVNGISGYSALSVGNVIKITNTAGRDFNLGVRGGITNKALTVIKGIARDISELPTQCFDGYTVKVNNTDDSDADDYFIKFESEASGIPGAGSWTETVAPGIKTTINSSTMPHALIRQADGSFTLDALNSDSAFGGWAPREVGDEVSNPEPSFVNRGVENMFFFANRLGFLSEDAVIMSQPGDYFNFFVTSALAVSDADPIDVTASSSTPAILKAAVGTPKGLVLFAERSQFLLATSEIAFSAATVKLTEISNYFYRSDVLPLNTGVSIAFISENITYSKVIEMAIDSVENRPAVADITRIVPELLPANFSWGEVSPNNNLMLFGEGTNDVYMFKFFNNGDKRELAGWTKWIYPNQVKLFAMEDDLCHIIMYDGERHILARSDLIDDPSTNSLDVGFSTFSPRLDLSIASSSLTISPDPAMSHMSRVYVPEDIAVDGYRYTYLVTDGAYKGVWKEPELKVDSSGNYYLLVSTELVSGSAVLGLGYDTVVTLPSVYVSSEGRSDRVNIPQVTFLYLDLYYSGRYLVTVDKLGYDAKVYNIEITPANSYDANKVPISEISTQSVPIFSSGDILNITITAPDPFPSSITGYSWEGSYNNRGINQLR